LRGKPPPYLPPHAGEGREGPGWPFSRCIAACGTPVIRLLRPGRDFAEGATKSFDPRRSAILLIGGDKTGDKRFYETMIPVADRLYDEYIEELKKESLLP
jgi:hypothetical protein